MRGRSWYFRLHPRCSGVTCPPHRIDFRKISERDGPSARLGWKLLRAAQAVFKGSPQETDKIVR